MITEKPPAVEAENITFKADDGTALRGWHFPPRSSVSGNAPIIVLHHGFSGVKEFYLDNYASLFAHAGLGVLVYDPRGFGDSDGRVRNEIDPFQQIADFRDAITFAMTLPRADSKRIGAWGSSYGGGVAIQATAIDSRIQCVVAQIPFLSGGAVWSHMPPEVRDQLARLFSAERSERAAGKSPMTMPVVSQDPTKTPCVLPTKEAWEWCTEAGKRAPKWRNEVTVRSFEMVSSFEPAAYIDRIAPRPFMMIGAVHDDLIPIGIAQQVFDRAQGPKEFVKLACGHFGAYQNEPFTQSASAARDWFVKHLRDAV